jgi:hypothetical protein
MSANQLGQRQLGAARLEVPQRDVECRDGLGGDARASYRRACPEQRLIDPVDVGGVLTDGDLGDLRQVRVLRPPARLE